MIMIIIKMLIISPERVHIINRQKHDFWIGMNIKFTKSVAKSINGCFFIATCIHLYSRISKWSRKILKYTILPMPMMSRNEKKKKKFRSLFAYWYEMECMHRYVSHCFDCRWHCMNYTVKFHWISYRCVANDFPAPHSIFDACAWTFVFFFSLRLPLVNERQKQLIETEWNTNPMETMLTEPEYHS